MRARWRSVTDQATEVDGEALPKGGERPVKPGSTVRVAKVLTLEFLAEAPPARVTDATNYTP